MPKYKYEIGDVVLITWRDSTQQEGWAKAEDIEDEPALITSVGIVYKKPVKARHIAIAGEWSPPTALSTKCAKRPCCLSAARG